MRAGGLLYILAGTVARAELSRRGFRRIQCVDQIRDRFQPQFAQTLVGCRPIDFFEHLYLVLNIGAQVRVIELDPFHRHQVPARERFYHHDPSARGEFVIDR